MRRRPVLLPEPDLRQLKSLCEALNCPDTIGGEEFRRLTAIWLQSGPNLEVMLRANPGLEQQLWFGYRVMWLSSKTGRGRLGLLPDTDPGDLASHGRVWFVTLTLNPDCEKLRACKHCRKYFVQASAKQTTYCSRACGTSLTAREHVKRRRDEAHRQKLERARVRMEQWLRARTEMPWPLWVEAKDPKLELTRSFLTRAVNKGELVPPTKTKSKATA
jgi:hypothetical protein